MAHGVTALPSPTVTVVEAGQHRWSTEAARQAAYRSAEVRRQNREAKAERQAEVARITAELDRSHIGPFALQAALVLAEAAILGDIQPPENALERKRLAETAEILHRIGRLELGESTSNAAHATLDAATVAARYAELERQLHPLDDE